MVYVRLKKNFSRRDKRTEEKGEYVSKLIRKSYKYDDEFDEYAI